MSYLMGIDLGTSSVKTLIMDEQGNTKGVAGKGYDVLIERQGWAEQNMEELWQATSCSIKEALDKAGILAKEITGIGFSGQMHGLVPLDKDGNVFRNVIIHMDQRSQEEVKIIESMNMRKSLLNPASTGFLGSSLVWMKHKEPDNYDKIAKVMLPKDYIRYRISGQIGTDITDAAGTVLFDLPKEAWCWEMIRKLDLREDMFPQVGYPSEVAGQVTQVCEKETGLAAGTPVVYGGGDQAMHSVGNGIVKTGIISTNIGTAGQVSCAVDSPLYDPQFRTNSFCHAGKGLWSLVGATLNGGIALKWLRENVISDYNYDEINEKAQSIKPGSEGLIFLPYLCGERSPHMNPNAKGMFFGLTLGMNDAHFIRAVMEGVVYSFKDCLEIFTQLNIHGDKIIASGGGAKSRIWMQIQADILEKEIYTTLNEEEACLGAAIVAGVGTGVYRNLEQACDSIIRLDNNYAVPNLENRKIYEEGYQKYRQLYVKNKELF